MEHQYILVDLNGIVSKNMNENQFYYGIARRILKDLHLEEEIDLDEFRKGRGELKLIEALEKLIDEVLMRFISKSLTIKIANISNLARVSFDTKDFSKWIEVNSSLSETDAHYDRLFIQVDGIIRADSIPIYDPKNLII
jgi:hypothetical protein